MKQHRELDCRRETLATGEDSSVLRFVTRADRTVQGLLLLMTESGPTGITEHPLIVNGPEMTIPHAGTVGAVSHRVVCPRRGLLEWTDPAPYIDYFLMRVTHTHALDRVDVPARGGRQSETYTRTISESVEQRIGRSVPGASTGGELLRAQDTRRQQQHSPPRLEQRFYREQDHATEIVRSLIREAQQRVWLIDRYFDAVEFRRYALSTTRRDIAVTIITSAECLSAPKSTRENGRALRDVIDKNLTEGQFTALVIPGDPPIIHDRFLVVDTTVWLLGNSFHSLGQTAGLLVQLTHAQDTITWLEEIMNTTRFMGLTEWLDTPPPRSLSSSLEAPEVTPGTTPHTETGSPAQGDRQETP